MGGEKNLAVEMIDNAIYEILCCDVWLPAPDPGRVVICPRCERVWAVRYGTD